MTMKALPPALRFVSPRELAERLEAERRGTPFLLYLDEGRHQHIIELAPGGALTIGREPDSEVALEWDSEVSRAHAMLERVGGAWTLVDDGLSRNGSFVGGDRVHGRRRLAPGEVIRVGRTVLVFAAGDAAGPVAAETRPQAPPPVLSP